MFTTEIAESTMAKIGAKKAGDIITVILARKTTDGMLDFAYRLHES